MEKIEYITGGAELLDLTQPLWTNLKQIHSRVSPHFSDHFSEIPFSVRKTMLSEKSRQGRLRVDLAKLANHNTAIGYCISTINKDRTGEIESLFVAEGFRSLGIGGRLMQNALEWMEKEHVKK
jgi:ribosomal protein S18 acetylase RimI-like enzyme